MTEAAATALSLSRVTRLGVIGIVWGSLLTILLVAGVCWVLIASSPDPDTELQRNGLAALWVASPALICTLVCIGAMLLGRRRAIDGRHRPSLLPALALVLLALVTLAALALGAVASAIAALTLA